MPSGTIQLPTFALSKLNLGATIIPTWALVALTTRASVFSEEPRPKSRYKGAVSSSAILSAVAFGEGGSASDDGGTAPPQPWITNHNSSRVGSWGIIFPLMPFFPKCGNKRDYPELSGITRYLSYHFQSLSDLSALISRFPTCCARPRVIQLQTNRLICPTGAWILALLWALGVWELVLPFPRVPNFSQNPHLSALTRT